ncbi:MAG: DUF3833 family protein [Alphaproteobacteria bacterium]|nr:DUF3833 family protein [Alphaproteobacteria bacterium]
MENIKGVLLMGLMMLLTSCSGPTLDHYAGSTPAFDLKAYFTGPIKAWGVVQDRKGHVTRKFDVEMIGTWVDDVGTLEEHFRYYDGETQKRTWIIRKIEDNRYEGAAGDIIGTAHGNVNGSAMRWKYEMDLTVEGSTYRITFDDWMFIMNDGVLINRSYLKKFGFTVAELTIFMQKQ